MLLSDLATVANNVFATWDYGSTTFKDYSSFVALPAALQWLLAGEEFTQFGRPCGYGLQASTCTCDTSDPPICANNATGGACVPSLDTCLGDQNTAKVIFAANTTQTVQLTVATVSGVTAAQLIIPAASLPLSQLIVRPVARSRMATAQHVVDNTR